MNFASGFGQTFFIALFAGSIRGEFGLSHGEWGTVYAIGTFSSAVLMLLLGGLADRVRARRITISIMVFCFVLSVNGYHARRDLAVASSNFRIAILRARHVIASIHCVRWAMVSA